MDTFIPDAQQEPRLGNLKDTAFFPEKVSAFAGLFPVFFRPYSGIIPGKGGKKAETFSGKKGNL